MEAVHARRLKIFGMSNKHLDSGQRAAAAEGFKVSLFPSIAGGAILPLVDHAFAFKSLLEAKQYLDSDAQLGKVVLLGPC